jgi:hypothetical protein
VAGATVTITATCTTGTVTGGGGSSSVGAGVAISASQPTAGNTGWTVTFYAGSLGAAANTVTAYAICAGP